MSVAQYQQNVGRVHPTLTWKGFAEVEIVVDATPGSLTAKQALYREVEEHVPADAALVPAQPWSALAELEPGLLHPERLLGLHFPLPAGRTPLVEVLFAKATSATVIERVRGHFAAAWQDKCCQPRRRGRPGPTGTVYGFWRGLATVGGRIATRTDRTSDAAFRHGVRPAGAPRLARYRRIRGTCPSARARAGRSPGRACRRRAHAEATLAGSENRAWLLSARVR